MSNSAASEAYPGVLFISLARKNAVIISAGPNDDPSSTLVTLAGKGDGEGQFNSPAGPSPFFNGL